MRSGAKQRGELYTGAWLVQGQQQAGRTKWSSEKLRRLDRLPERLLKLEAHCLVFNLLYVAWIKFSWHLKTDDIRYHEVAFGIRFVNQKRWGGIMPSEIRDNHYFSHPANTQRERDSYWTSPLIFLCFTRPEIFKINVIFFCAFKICFLDISSFDDFIILKVVYTKKADLEVQTWIQIPRQHEASIPFETFWALVSWHAKHK